MSDVPPTDVKRTQVRAVALPAFKQGQIARSKSSLSRGDTLPQGTRLGEFEIIDLIGEGGFGIVYLAFDHSLQRRVALKEYMPSSLAARTTGALTVVVKSEQHEPTFRAGLRSFINEARLLAQFDHPALVKVHRFWEENGTAYMIMPFYEGPTLKQALAQLAEAPDEAWLRDLLEPLLDALSVLHSVNCYHRDIAPDNILLTQSGPLLLDFGAARKVIGDANRALTVVLKPGYAPIEQYGEVETLKQGPWTDIYALACVIYCAITRKAPATSIERLIMDRMESISVLAAGRYSEAFLHAIDAGLAIKPQDRPQSIAQFRALLTDVSETLVRVSAPAKRPKRPSASIVATANSHVQQALRDTNRRMPRMIAWYAIGGVAIVAIASMVWSSFLQHQSQEHPVSQLSNHVASADIPAPATLSRSVLQKSVSPSPSIAAPAPRSHVAEHSEISQALPVGQAVANSAADLPPANAVKQLPTTIAPSENRSPVTLTHNPAPQRQIHSTNDVEQSRARCRDILQKASLETLTPEETTFLKKECT